MPNQSPGERLASLRAGLGMSVSDLAKRSGVNRMTIDRIEKGQDPKLSTYLRLLRALGITAEGRGALVAGLVPMEGAADV
ncbi:MAG: helix-turn-helix transcriptional regulator [Hyphomicrobiaceae bacterium]|nr:helix-turn-helix transcriptional regulator [Hyphomicrobiaceae bacterium]